MGEVREKERKEERERERECVFVGLLQNKYFPCLHRRFRFQTRGRGWRGPSCRGCSALPSAEP